MKKEGKVESGKILRLVKQPGPAGTKKENLPPRHEDTRDFYYKKFFFVSLCLCGHFFYFLPGNGKILESGNQS